MLPMVIRSRIFGLTLLCFSLSATFSAQNQPIDLDLTVHEWGTFTSIAGGDGLAEKWSTLNGSAVLPHFVDHFSGPQAKAGLLGTVRMETPVLYFYSPHEVTVSVKVKFSKGLITEWYPQASRVKPDPEKVLDREALYRRHGGGSIAWDSVTVSPNLAPGFPRENEGNQYYAARKTSAAPLVVKTAAGDQQERFLFYRGVSTFSVPISATVTPEGNLRIKNLAQEEISSVILAPWGQGRLPDRWRAPERNVARPSGADRDFRFDGPGPAGHFDRSGPVSRRGPRHDRDLAAIVV